MRDRLARLLIGLVPASEREALLGDLEEARARIVRVHGPAAAGRWMLRQAAGAVCYGVRDRMQRGIAAARHARWRSSSVGHALRALWRTPTFAALTTGTLALG